MINSFDEIDTDGDGKISQTEFKTYMDAKLEASDETTSTTDSSSDSSTSTSTSSSTDADTVLDQQDLLDLIKNFNIVSYKTHSEINFQDNPLLADLVA
jgi:Ca2+-binding EF-hand superfamily protein